jgi:hypothetical protein
VGFACNDGPFEDGRRERGGGGENAEKGDL